MLRFVQLLAFVLSLTALWLSPSLPSLPGIRGGTRSIEGSTEPRRLQAVPEAAEPGVPGVTGEEAQGHELTSRIGSNASAKAAKFGAVAERRMGLSRYFWDAPDWDERKGDAKETAFAGIGTTLVLTIATFAESGTDWDKAQINAVAQSAMSLVEAAGMLGGPGGALMAGVASGLFAALNPWEDDDLDEKLAELKEDRACASLHGA